MTTQKKVNGNMKIITTIISICIGIATIVVMAYTFGTVKGDFITEHVEIKSDIETNCKSIELTQDHLAAEIKRSTDVDEKQTDVLNRLDKNLTVQSVLLEEVKEELRKP